MKPLERITHAAVLTNKGYAVLGKCHADCFYSGKNTGLKMSNKSDDQGFFTSRGRYVNRILAARIAKKAGQLDPSSNRKVYALLSEDIWHQRARFEYSQVRGYFEVVLT